MRGRMLSIEELVVEYYGREQIDRINKSLIPGKSSLSIVVSLAAQLGHVAAQHCENQEELDLFYKTIMAVVKSAGDFCLKRPPDALQ